MTIKVTIKHDDNANTGAIRVQAWHGKIPTFDSEAQRRQALRKASGEDETKYDAATGKPVGMASREDLGSKDYNTSGVDTENAKKPGGQSVEAAKQSGFDFDKMDQKELVAFAMANKIDMSDIDIEDEDDKPELVKKLKDWAKIQPVAQNPEQAKTDAQKKIDQQVTEQKKIDAQRRGDFTFNDGSVLQEHTISAGETKTFEIPKGAFITIKEDI